MVQVVKSEWHQVEKRYQIEIDRDTFGEIYFDLEDDEVDSLFEQFESGEIDVEQVIQKAWDEGVDLDWDWMDEDDWWTDRKGGYEVTFEVQK
jgi:hypothetical protein